MNSSNTEMTEKAVWIKADQLLPEWKKLYKHDLFHVIQIYYL